MELCTIEKWQYSEYVEIFFNSLQRHLVFKKYNFIYSKGVDDTKSHPYVDLKDFSGYFLSCSFSPKGNILAFQLNSHDIEFFLPETEQNFTLSGKNKTILGYHWLTQSLYSDFVVIDTSGIEFYKIFPKLGKIMTVRNYQHSIGHYWFESTEGIIVVASSPPKLGLFSTFFVNQTKGPKYFNGQRFNVDLSPSVTDKWTEPSPHISTLGEKVEPSSFPNAHCVRLVYLYGSTYFVHIHCLNGSMSMYKLNHEKVLKVADSVQVPPGSYGVRTNDNILILQNYSLQESHLIDIRSKKYGFTVFYSFWNGMQIKPKVSIKLHLSEAEGDLQLNSEVLYGGKPYKRSEKFLSLKGTKAAVAECGFTLEKHLVYIDNDICVDIKKGRCYKLVISPIFVTENHPDKVEAILFLLRRSHCKHRALQQIKKLLKERTDTKVIAELFSIFASQYKIAALEKKNRATQAKPEPHSRKNSFSSETDMKIEQGTLLLQSEILGVVILPLYEENIMDMNLLAFYVEIYAKTMWNEDLQVQHNIQIVLVKILMRKQNFQKIEQLMQHNVVSDSMDACNLLLTNCHLHEPFWQTGVDMLIRLKEYDRLVEVLIDKNFYFESYFVLEIKSAMKIDIIKLISQEYQEVDQNLINTINILIKEWMYLNSSTGVINK